MAVNNAWSSSYASDSRSITKRSRVAIAKVVSFSQNSLRCRNVPVRSLRLSLFFYSCTRNITKDVFSRALLQGIQVHVKAQEIVDNVVE